MDFEQELTRLADSYRNQGYLVVVRPGADQLPGFAKDFKVEILGRRGAENVLVAVKKNRDEFAADQNMARYAEILGQQPGWRFDIALLGPESSPAREFGTATEPTELELSHELGEAERLSRMGFARSALVSAWAALEAAMRRRLRSLGTEVGWGSASREMLRELYSAGVLSPDEFRRIEQAAQTRNQIVHGFSSQLEDAGGAAAVDFLNAVTRRLVRESQPVPQSA